jgi:hypothetical protein
MFSGTSCRSMDIALYGNRFGIRLRRQVAWTKMDLAEIQHAIEQLPKVQQAALAAWLAERDQAEWDAEIERDFAAGGAGIALLDEMKADVRAGRFRPFEEGRPPQR